MNYSLADLAAAEHEYELALRDRVETYEFELAVDEGTVAVDLDALLRDAR